MLPELEDYDWEQAFEVAQRDNPIAVIGDDQVPTSPFTRDDVARIIAKAEGENDGESWVGVFELKDGRFAYVTAWCDYTGWG